MFCSLCSLLCPLEVIEPPSNNPLSVASLSLLAIVLRPMPVRYVSERREGVSGLVL